MSMSTLVYATELDNNYVHYLDNLHQTPIEMMILSFVHESLTMFYALQTMIKVFS